MDRKILDIIEAEIKRLPPIGSPRRRWRQYEHGKARLCKKYPGYEEHICKALAKRYKL